MVGDVLHDGKVVCDEYVGEIELVLQVNGKVRGRISIAADASQDDIEAAARADEKVAELLAGATVRKVVVVPGRMVNFVVG